jgi:hypothetical protein
LYVNRAMWVAGKGKRGREKVRERGREEKGEIGREGRRDGERRKVREKEGWT